MHPRRLLRRSLLRPPSATVLCAALSLATPAAAADEGFALSRFEPSFAGDKLFAAQSPYGAGESTFVAMVLFDYAHNPLVLRDGSGGMSYGAIVGDQVLLHLDASYALWRRLTFNVDLPIGYQRGEQPMGGGFSFGSPTSVALADLRLGVRATLFGEAEDAFQLALGALVWLPTGSRSAYTGDGQVRSLPMLIAGGSTRWFVWSANVGPELRPEVSFVNDSTGASLRWGAGMGFLPGDGSFQIGPELSGSVTFDDPQKTNTDLEAMVSARVRFARAFTAGLGAALGLAPGMGTPDFRTVISLAYQAPDAASGAAAAAADRDGDGISDLDDACPDVKGVRTADPKTNGCPPPPVDRDDDGIPDAEDACPDVPGPRDPVPTFNGCPPDRDNDGIPDAKDACPDQIGPSDPDPKKNGCPAAAPPPPTPAPPKHAATADSDGDGILDADDACPELKGLADPDPRRNGCPPGDVHVTEGAILILQEVEFDPGKAVIYASSNGLLDAVAQAFREHPEILKVEVQGHTDNTGPAEQNIRLSQHRAEAVAAALVKRGIDASRLVAKGYGPTRPIMANLTTQGRRKNRRVEFHILERKKP